MTMRLSQDQMTRFRDAEAAAQLKAAAEDLHAIGKGSFSRDEAARALDRVVARVFRLGIKRMKWLKILALWELHPEAAPDSAQVDRILAAPGDQDSRMRAVLALPAGQRPGAA